MGLKIMIVEDESLVLVGLVALVKQIGHEVIATANNGNDAFEKAIAVTPDLLLMDIRMDPMNGLEAFRLIKEKMDIPCIFITAYEDDSLINEAVSLGCNGFLIKPVTKGQLKAAIDVCTEQFRAKQNAIDEANNYKTALKDQKLIQHAKGVLMDHLNIKESQAMSLLQKKSRDNNKKIAVIAQEIIDAEKLLSK